MTKPKMDGDGTRELMPQETDAKRAAKPLKKGEVPVTDRTDQTPAEDLPLAKDDPTVK